jgi:hypothetical protein
MANLLTLETEHQVEVSLTGGFRRAAINVEATGIGLRKKADELIGSKKILIADPIEVIMTFKGAEGVEYVLAIKINGVEKKRSGSLLIGGVNVEKHQFQFSDFQI